MILELVTCTTFFVWTTEAIDVLLRLNALFALPFLVVLPVIGGRPSRVMGNKHLVDLFLPPLGGLYVSNEV